MPEPTKTEGQEPEVKTPVEPVVPKSQEPKADLEVYTREYVSDLRKESTNYRTKYSDEKKRADAAEAQLSAMKLQQRESATKSAITDAAAAANAAYPDVIVNLALAGELEIDDTGKPNAEKLKSAIESIKKDYPALFKTPPTGRQIDASEKGQSAGAGFNDWIRGSLLGQ